MFMLKNQQLAAEWTAAHTKGVSLRPRGHHRRPRLFRHFPLTKIISCQKFDLPDVGML